MYINRFLHSKNGKIILSIILGVGFSSVFRKICKNKECLIFKAPIFDDIKEKIFGFNNKCYTFKEQIVKCDSNKKTISFA